MVLVNGFNHAKGSLGVAHAWRGLAVLANVVEERLKLEVPGVVGHGVFPGKGLGRAEFGGHLVVSHALGAIAAAEAGDFNLAGASVDFEGEEVLPLGPGGVEEGGLAGGG